MNNVEESIKRNIIPVVEEFEAGIIDLEECIKRIWDIDGGVPFYAADRLLNIVFGRETSTSAERDRIEAIYKRSLEENMMSSFLDVLAQNLTRD